MDRSDIQAVIAEFTRQLHKRALEYKGFNGDFIGEQLWHEVPPQAFYHLRFANVLEMKKVCFMGLVHVFSSFLEDRNARLFTVLERFLARR
jgi:hypothetical protein